jgi:gliding motility-associated protein GldM
MASKKETPRQKMISVMYLVLTAILALNVSQEILDAFVVIDKGLENTNRNFVKHNEELYAQFELAKTVDPNRVTPCWKKAQRIREEANALTDFIEKIKVKLISKTEGISEQMADTLQLANIDKKDDDDVATYVMIGNSEDGSAGASRELKNKINTYRSLLNNYILPTDREKVEINLDTQDPPKNEDNQNWEMYNFSERPLVACITILSKIQNDVKTAEAKAVDYLLKQVDKGSLKFDTVAAKVIPRSNYVLLGEEYKADVFLAAFNKTRNPEMRIGKFNTRTHTFEGPADALPVERGLGKYAIKTTREGIVNYAGVIKIVSPSGEEMSFPFQSEYIVAKPALTVSADNMNVFYAGLDNFVSVSVPGIPNERLQVSIINGNIHSMGNGKFMVKVMDGVESIISAVATTESGEKRNMGSMKFRVKRVPKPSLKYAGLTDDGTLSKQEIKNNSGVIAYYENFLFDAKCKVTSFTLSIMTRGSIEDYDVTSNMFSVKLKERLDQLKRGDRLMFSNVKVLGPDSKTVKANGFIVKVK